MLQKEKIDRFVSAITDDAENERIRIEAETKAYITSELNLAENDALYDSYRLIQRSLSEIRANVGIEVSEKAMRLNRTLLDRRNQIRENVFNKVKQRTVKFTDSDNYEVFLITSAKKSANVIRDSEVTIFIRPVDSKYIDCLSNSIPNSKVEIDDTIKLGGIKMTGSSGKIIVDDTLDRRFESQYDWFNKNSGLII